MTKLIATVIAMVFGCFTTAAAEISVYGDIYADIPYESDLPQVSEKKQVQLKLDENTSLSISFLPDSKLSAQMNSHGRLTLLTLNAVTLNNAIKEVRAKSEKSAATVNFEKLNGKYASVLVRKAWAVDGEFEQYITFDIFHTDGLIGLTFHSKGQAVSDSLIDRVLTSVKVFQ